ncbi:YihY/virulence factor BrkB family protein [Zhihengliuella sp.]|uniref:YihY/virulence factor BrkB family protein n=1 Tax=Zhihengliuella sp. TaxID=1954483 RepID=UPI0028127868|nr:YihY/virulence factor BrkB family protein [Zhihengliuella sp.]
MGRTPERRPARAAMRASAKPAHRDPRPAARAGDETDDDSLTALDRVRLRHDVLRRSTELRRASREGRPVHQRALALLGWLVAHVQSWLPVRAFTVYGQRRGGLMAAGTAYLMFFSVASMLVAGFAILGLVAAGNQELQDLVVRTVDRSTPGLIGAEENALVTREQLFNAQRGFGWALVISTAVTVFSSLRWIDGLRQGMRGVFGLPHVEVNVALLKLRDLGVLLILGASLIVTSVVGLVAGAALDWTLEMLGVASAVGAFFAQATTILVMLLLDIAVSMILFRLASMISMPRRALLEAALIAGAGATVLRLFSSVLLGGLAGRPIIGSFAVVLGLFVWFYLLSQVYLVATAWGAVVTADAHAERAASTGVRALSLRQRAQLKRSADDGGRPEGGEARV